MDTEDLRAFVETCRRGSLTRAAGALGVTQPSVSRRIQRLEAEVGAVLVERTRPTVTPTRRGLEVLGAAEAILRSWEELVAQGPGARSLTGTVHVAASTAPGASLVPGLLARFSALYPDVRSELHVMNSDAVEACVMACRCDLGFLGRRPGTRALEVVEVARDELVLVVPRGHPLAARPRVVLGDLAGLEFVGREAGSGTWRVLEERLAAEGRTLPPHRLMGRLSTPGAVIAAVAAGQGVSIVSRMAIEETPSPAVVQVRIADLDLARPIMLVYDAVRIGSLGRSFVDFVRQASPPPG